MNLIAFCDRIIRYSFYAIFFFVPLVFAGNTSELFEFNKMWVTFGFTTFIALAWFTKMTLERKVIIQRTPLDIPLLLFLLSQIISSIFSLDQHVSWWGYYSRFNGGLLSTICYVFLYYAFASNLNIKQVFKSLVASLVSGLAVCLWGFPSHFGYDPTCLVFRGSLDTNCWTEAFKPTIRVFSTLGQPAWLGAYLAVLLPIGMAYALKSVKFQLKFWLYTGLVFLFFADLVFANTRATFLAFALTDIVFWGIVLWRKILEKKEYLRYFFIFQGIFLLSGFFFGIPVDPFYQYTLPAIQAHSKATSQVAQTPGAIQPTPAPQQPTTQTATQTTPPADTGITNSANIRLYVWKGAIDAWKSNAFFGTGVETFAFAYYKYRPVGHNLTSEWDYLYNKAHNEYLNYLTTTGLFGLGTYLSFIGLFIFFVGKWYLPRKNSENTTEYDLTIIALFAGWLSILVTNFFGFSVVIMNIYLFMIPLFAVMLADKLPDKVWEFSLGTPSHTTSPYQWTLVAVYAGVSIYFISVLTTYWYADTKYALGYNLDRVNSYQDAYPLLLEAVKIKPNESVYSDELAINMAVLSSAFAQQNDAVNSEQFANNAIELSNQVTTKHPNNVVYWKNRVRMFYTLAPANPSHQLTYYQEALKAILVAHDLAPTDAKISYNLGVLYGQTGNIPKGIEILQATIQMKPDYRDAYFALGLFMHEAALDQNRRIVNTDAQAKAVEVYQYILKNIDPKDKEVQKTLDDWAAGKN